MQPPQLVTLCFRMFVCPKILIINRQYKKVDGNYTSGGTDTKQERTDTMKGGWTLYNGGTDTIQWWDGHYKRGNGHYMREDRNSKSRGAGNYARLESNNNRSQNRKCPFPCLNICYLQEQVSVPLFLRMYASLL